MLLEKYYQVILPGPLTQNLLCITSLLINNTRMQNAVFVKEAHTYIKTMRVLRAIKFIISLYLKFHLIWNQSDFYFTLENLKMNNLYS